jgi:hypothetical protein
LWTVLTELERKQHYDIRRDFLHKYKFSVLKLQYDIRRNFLHNYRSWECCYCQLWKKRTQYTSTTYIHPSQLLSCSHVVNTPCTFTKK